MKYLIILSIFLYSCSAQKRINRICRKNPEVCRLDSVTIRDTITIESHSTDTVFQHIASNDTIRIEDSVMVIKYVNNGKTVYKIGRAHV